MVLRVVTWLLLAAVAHGLSQDILDAYPGDFQGMRFGDDPTAPNVMNLNIMEDSVAAGAVCLDGTPSGFYYAPANSTANAKKWQIYFQGGGWCYDEMDCWGRSNGGLGSSTHWAKTSTMGGIMSADCKENPDLCGYHRVHMPYCDGNSFSGNRDEPIVVKGRKLYFRGRRILDLVMKHLMALGLDQADTVLLTGCSAGGLATFLHTDYVRSLLPAGVTKYASTPISGFFLNHNTVDNGNVYPKQMQYIYSLANSTNGLNADCVKAMAPADQWKCNFAENAYEYTKSRIFPLNSCIDSWQLSCIATSALVPGFPHQNTTSNGHCCALPGWGECCQKLSCTSAQKEAVAKYQHDFMSTMSSKTAYTKAGNGGFIDAEHSHCAGQGGGWQGYVVDGKTMQQWHSEWWNSDPAAPASQNTHTACTQG